MRLGVKGYWDRKRKQIAEERQSGNCTINIHKVYPTRIIRGSVGSIKVTKVRARLHVICPFDSNFTAGARELLGRWKPATGVWTFDGRTYRHLLELCQRVYGADRVTVQGEKSLVKESDV